MGRTLQSSWQIPEKKPVPPRAGAISPKPTCFGLAPISPKSGTLPDRYLHLFPSRSWCLRGEQWNPLDLLRTRELVHAPVALP